MTRSKSARIGSWVARIIVVVILGQTLFFKFAYAPETQWIFGEKLGVGRVGATGAALVELAAVILILVPATIPIGALVALGTMLGAIGSHLAVLGIETINPETGLGDGGLLFGMAIVVSICAAFVLAVHRDGLPIVGKNRRRS